MIVKTMLGEVGGAKRRKIIDANPFDSLRSGPTPSKDIRYITPDEIQRVIDACPDAEWRLLFGLARYAGLGIPSESHRLIWADMEFEGTAQTPATCAQRLAQRKASDGAGNEQKQGNDAERAEARNSAANSQTSRDLRLVSASPGVSEEWSRGDSNPRAGTVGLTPLRV